MLFYMLTHSTNRTFLFSNGKFKFLIKSMHPFQVFGAEQLKQECAYLGEITKNAFYVGMKAVVFRAVGHNQFRC